MSRPHDDSPDVDLAVTSDPGQPSDTPTRGPDGAAWRYAPGAIVAGEYRIVGLLGRGGMGEVYRADDLTLGQPVALKFLPAQWGRDRREWRSSKRGRVARRSATPNSAGSMTSPKPRRRSCRWSPSTARSGVAAPPHRPAAAGRAVTSAASVRRACGRARPGSDSPRPEARERDDRRDGSVRMADFGIATAVALGDVPLAGTPQYMAPEQLNGGPRRSRPISTRSDWCSSRFHR